MRDGTCRRNIRYCPLPSQRAFHRSRARFKGFSGPIGSGKSQALCQEAIKLSYLNAGRFGVIGAPTYPMLRDATQAALFEILNSNSIPYEYNKADNVLVMKDTDSRILFRSVDDFERLRGTNLAWFGLDELTYTSQEAWLRLEGRLRDSKAKRLCGFAVWTPKGYDWVYQKFICDPVRGYEAIIAPGLENRFLLDQVPDFYERLKDSYDENFYRQEVLGEYLNVRGGRVYTSFDRQQNLAPLEVDEFVPLLWALDFNVDPMSSVIAQKVQGTLRVLDEIVMRHASTREACEAFYARFPKHRAGIVVYGDASGNTVHSTGTSDYQIVRDYFKEHCDTTVQYRVPNCNPLVRERVALTNAKLRSASGEVHLLTDPKCKELIKDFEQVSYKADSNQLDKDKDCQRTHLSDALGYLLWQEFRFTDPIGHRAKRLF